MMTEQRTTADQLRDNVKSVAQCLEDLVKLYNGHLPEDRDDRDECLGWATTLNDMGADLDLDDLESIDWSDTAREILETDLLEYVEHGTRQPGGEWEMTHICAVFTIGGPHIELDTSEGAVMGYWSSDRARFGVSSDVVEYFEQMAGE